MKYFDWSIEKNELLKSERGISYEDVIIALNEETILAILPHPNQKKDPNQQIFVLAINNYAYLVPYIETEDTIFLKTIIPSRQATKKYLINK
jgi:uncharacterized DUF497 family protein